MHNKSDFISERHEKVKWLMEELRKYNIAPNNCINLPRLYKNDVLSIGLAFNSN